MFDREFIGFSDRGVQTTREDEVFFKKRRKHRKDRKEAKKLLSKLNKVSSMVDLRKTLSRWGNRKSVSIISKKHPYFDIITV